MDIDLNGVVSRDVSGAGIAAAIKSRPKDAEWSVVLLGSEGDFLQGFAARGEQFRLSCHDKGKLFDGKELVTAQRLVNVMTAYLNGEDKWRAAIAWRRSAGNRDIISAGGALWDEMKLRRQGKAVATRPGELSAVTIFLVFGVLAFFGLAFVTGLFGLRAYLPWPFNTDVGFPLTMACLLPVAITLVVMQASLSGYRRAAKWPMASGRITISEMRANRTESKIANAKFDNIPYVAYEFLVVGKTVTADRISFGNEAYGENAAATLARYPVGSTQFVYYNPADPTEAVLDRTMPKGMGKGCLWIVVILVAVVGVLAAFSSTAPAWLEAHMTHVRNSNLAVLTVLMGLFAMMLSVGATLRSRRAAGWPRATGEITFSGIEANSASIGSGGGRSTNKVFTPKIEYSYEVNGQSYLGHQIRLGMRQSGSQAAARKVADRYSVGTKVEVMYDPTQPSRAALQNTGAASLFIFAFAAVMLVFSAYEAGMF